jgi:RNA polymerase-interacting CarD/CdnL/TRCF family regulator
MKRAMVMCGLMLYCLTMPVQKLAAQIPIAEIIKAGVKKVIRAIDLKIQRLQNETIWLQNAQKTLENKMQELKLAEISDWVEKQRKLYADYYEELWRVKSAITYYDKVKDIIHKQVQLVDEYKQAIALLKRDKHFAVDDIEYMEKVYSGILHESIKNLDQVNLVINSFVTQMSDAKRLELINVAESNIEQNLVDLRQFNNQNIRLSLQRAKDKSEINAVKALYGIK